MTDTDTAEQQLAGGNGDAVAGTEAPAAEPGDADAASTSPGSGRRTLALVVGLTAVVGAIPAAVALLVMRKPHWYPLLDLAQTELRLRDFENGHPPLLGLASRVEAFDKRGSHLGPMQFWAMYPFYKLYGSTAWGFQAAGATVNLIAMGLAIWIGHRRAQLRGALAVAAVIGVLGQAYGAEQLVSEHWIPHTPLMWWIVFLLAVWSVLVDDLPMLPVAVFAGSFCIQTHIPYLGQVLGLMGIAALVVGLGAWRNRPDKDGLRRLVRWTGAALALLAVLWAPPVIEQFTTEPGNLSIMRESLGNPDDELVGFGGDAIRTALVHLNPWGLFAWDRTDPQATAGSPGPGVVMLAVWAASVLVAWRIRRTDLLRLHLVVGVAVLLGYVSVARIAGDLFYYLVLWAWGTTALLCAAVIWTFAAAWPSKWPRLQPAQATLALLAVVLAGGGYYTYESAYAEVSTPHESYVVSQVTPPTIERLREGDLPGTGEDGDYLVDFSMDAGGIGEQGQGLFLELERQGFDVGVPGNDRGVVVAMVPHRVKERDEVSAVVYYVVGDANIDLWRNTEGATEIAHYEPRTPAEIERYEEIRAEVKRDLRREGLDGSAEALDRNTLMVGLAKDTPLEITHKIQDMMALGLPAAVFHAAPDIELDLNGS